MKTNMEEIDKLIKESLTKEEARFYDELEEQSVFASLGGLFATRNRWLMILINIIVLISLVLFVYCLVAFLKAEETKELFLWGGGGMVCLMMVCMLKIFAWLQMDRNALMREIKRLELQVSSLATKK